jgi:hypothetical protein
MRKHVTQNFRTSLPNACDVQHVDTLCSLHPAGAGFGKAQVAAVTVVLEPRAAHAEEKAMAELVNVAAKPRSARVCEGCSYIRQLHETADDVRFALPTTGREDKICGLAGVPCASRSVHSDCRTRLAAPHEIVLRTSTTSSTFGSGSFERQRDPGPAVGRPAGTRRAIFRVTGARNAPFIRHVRAMMRSFRLVRSFPGYSRGSLYPMIGGLVDAGEQVRK